MTKTFNLYICGFLQGTISNKIPEGAKYSDNLLRKSYSKIEPLHLQCSCKINTETKYALTKNFLYYTDGKKLMRHDLKSSLIDRKEEEKNELDAEIINTSKSGNQLITSLHANSNFVSVVLNDKENNKSITLTLTDDGASTTFDTGEDDVCEFIFGKKFGLINTTKKIFYIDSKCLKTEKIDIQELSSPISSSIKSIACGKEHALVLTKDLKILTIGGGSRGQLGNGSAECTSTLSAVSLLELLQINAIAAGGWHSLVISNGDLYGWGWNESGQIGCPASLDDETIKTTEDNIPKLLFEPTLVDTPMDKSFICVSAGSRHSAAVTDDGLLYTWGWNGYGQLCQGDQENRLTPCLVSYFEGKEVVDVVCSDWATLVVTTVKDDEPS